LKSFSSTVRCRQVNWRLVLGWIGRIDPLIEIMLAIDGTVIGLMVALFAPLLMGVQETWQEDSIVMLRGVLFIGTFLATRRYLVTILIRCCP
jgi:hypothetical protein